MMLWNSTELGTAIRTPDGYRAKPVVKPKSGARKLTEVEDNALARAKRRRTNRAMRGWLPHAKR